MGNVQCGFLSARVEHVVGDDGYHLELVRAQIISLVPAAARGIPFRANCRLRQRDS